MAFHFFKRRVDTGRIKKRPSTPEIQFATHFGACSKLFVHVAFRTPTKILTRNDELPGNLEPFTIARAISALLMSTPETTAEFAIALGFELHPK